MNYTLREAEQFLQSNSDAIVTVAKATEIVTAFKLPASIIPVQEFNLQGTHGLIWKDGKAVSVGQLATRISEELDKRHEEFVAEQERAAEAYHEDRGRGNTAQEMPDANDTIDETEVR
jgi:hypothetical protein